MRKIIFSLSLTLFFAFVSLGNPSFGQKGEEVDYSSISLLINLNPDAEGTYEDYMASRTPAPYAEKVIDRGEMRLDSGEKVLVMVNSGLRPNIETRLQRYLDDLEIEGYSPILIEVSGGTHVDVRNTIIANSSGLVGVAFVGDIPVAWFDMDGNDFDNGWTEFPCDYYYMELDGTWEDTDGDGLYNTLSAGSGDEDPEIFVGRIDASMMSANEITLTNHYFDKLHNYYTGELDGTDYGLTYVDDDWQNNSDINYAISNAYPDYQNIAGTRTAIHTERNDYLYNRLKSNTYEYIQLCCHSYSGGCSFTRGGWLYSSTVIAEVPQAIFYNFFNCSGARFTDSNYFGGAHIFNTSTKSLGGIGSTKTGSMLSFWAFYQPLGDEKSHGQAFKEWFEYIAPFSLGDTQWHMGMALIGDPFVIPKKNYTRITVESPAGGELWGVGTTQEITWTSISDMGPEVKIDLYKGGVLESTITSSTSNDGSYSWSIPLEQTLGSDYRVRITSISYPSYWGESQADFSIIISENFYVNGETGNDSWDGLAPEWDGMHGPKLTIQAGMDAAAPGDNVIVANGTYTGAGNRDLDFDGKAITVKSANGPGNTTIDCENAGRGFYCFGVADYQAIIDGFTIINGYTTDKGGAIHCAEGSMTVKNCIIAHNTSVWNGGGIFCRLSTDVKVINCLIHDNSSNDGQGGGVFAAKTNIIVMNCTITDNYAGNSGGGMGCDNLAEANTIDTIFYYNSALSGNQISLRSVAYPSTVKVEFCNVQGVESGVYVTSGNILVWGDGNMGLPPLFANGIFGDHYLSHTACGETYDSPCVDSGSNTAQNLGLEELTTRTDQGYDTGIVDTGYHYPISTEVNITSIEMSGDDATIVWNARPGVSYTVQYSTNMADWTSVPVGETNTWTDIDTLFNGLVMAMEKNPKIKFVSTGGEIPEQDLDTYPRFLALINNSPYRERFVMKGWIAGKDVPDHYLEADLGINIDRDIYEVRLGSKNRILDWFRAELCVLSTNVCELTDIMEKKKIGFTFRAGDAEDLSSRLIYLAGHASIVKKTGIAGRRYGLEYFNFGKTTERLQEWVKKPAFSPDHGKDRKLFFSKEKALGNLEQITRRQKKMIGERDKRITELEGIVKRSLPYRVYSYFKIAKRKISGR